MISQNKTYLLQPLLKKYDAKMQEDDGWVKAIADDVY